jgi:hypothetical protein
MQRTLRHFKTLHICEKPCKIDGFLHLVDLVQKNCGDAPPILFEVNLSSANQGKRYIILLIAAHPMLSLLSHHHHRVHNFALLPPAALAKH